MGLHRRLQRRAPKWHSDRPGPPRPCRLVSSRGTPFPSPLPDGGAPTRPGCCCPSLGEPPGASGPAAWSTPHPAPRSGSGPHSGPRRRGRTSRDPALTSPARGPAASARYSPPTRYMLAAMAVPAAASGRTMGPGGWGVGSARGEGRARGWRRAEVSVGHAQPAPPPPQPSQLISARSAAPPPPPLTPDAEARAVARLLPERARLRRLGTGSAPALAAPLQTLGPRPRLRLLPERLRRTGEQGGRSARVGERDPGARPLPEAARLPPAAAARARVFPLRLRPASGGGRGAGLTLSWPRPPPRPPPGASGGWLFASGFPCRLYEWRSLAARSALLWLRTPTPSWPGGTPPSPTKGLGGDFAFGLLPLSRQRESGPRLGRPGSASGSVRCVLGCWPPPPGECAIGNVSESRKRSAPSPGAEPSGRARGSRSAAVRRQGRRPGTERGFARAWRAPVPSPRRPAPATGRCWRPCRPAR